MKSKTPCLIIAEAGVNHNGNAKLAHKLIDAAAQAGADAIKFQTFTASELVTKQAKLADYQKKNTGKQYTQHTMLKKLELTEQNFVRLKKHCDDKKILFLSTPHTTGALIFLDTLVTIHKIGSGDLTNLPFLENIARCNKPIILSTGMGTLKEVQTAVQCIKNKGNKKITILHCTTHYPCPLEEVNLRAMVTLKTVFKMPVGYSDHTVGITVPIMAVALGAQVIEKHFTIDVRLPGPDHKASLNPNELKTMINAIRNAEQALGSAIKKPTKSEQKIKKIVRKSIVAKTDIPKNTIITQDMLTIKRPATGLAPRYIKTIIGKKTKKNIRRDTHIIWHTLQ